MAKTDRMDKNKYSVVFFLRDKPKKQWHSKAEGKKKKDIRNIQKKAVMTILISDRTDSRTKKHN